MCFCNYDIYENILSVWENIGHFLLLRIQEKLRASNYLPLYPSEEYWASLQESAFSKLVQMFKRAMGAQLHYWSESVDSNCHVRALLEVLKRLHRVRVLSETHMPLFCHENSLGFNVLNVKQTHETQSFYCYF